MDVLALQKATLAARARGHEKVGTCVSKGRFSVVEVTYGKGGRSKVDYLARDLPLVDAVAFIEAL